MGKAQPTKGDIMKRFTVYFELYGKKMKVDKDAESAFDAESKVRKDIRINKITEVTTIDSIFKDIFDGLGKK